MITRDSVRYYLAIGVSSAGARESVETGRGSGAASSCGGECAHGCNGKAAGHWCHGCRSDGVLWLQVGALAVCTHAVAAMRAGKDRL